MRVTEKGQITIPKRLRDTLGIEPGTTVEFEVQGEALLVRKTSGLPTRGEALVGRLRGRGDVRLTTDEIMAMTRAD